MAFGPALRVLRLAAGASLRDVAGAVGVSSAYLSRVENGHDPAPTPDRIIGIASALGVPPALLLELAERVDPAVADYLSEVPTANRLFLEIARRRLGAADVARVLAFLDAEFPDPRAARSDRASPTVAALLTPDHVILGVRCDTMDDVLDLAAARLAPTGRAAAALAAALRVREAQGPTSLGHGLVAPHTSAGDALAAALVCLASPLGAGADGQPIRAALVLVGLGDSRLGLLGRAALLARAQLVDALDGVGTPQAAIVTVDRVERWAVAR
jgi:PTS system nitrogen regulatory IIA component